MGSEMCIRDSIAIDHQNVPGTEIQINRVNLTRSGLREVKHRPPRLLEDFVGVDVVKQRIEIVDFDQSRVVNNLYVRLERTVDLLDFA